MQLKALVILENILSSCLEIGYISAHAEFCDLNICNVVVKLFLTFDILCCYTRSVCASREIAPSLIICMQ